MTEYLLSEDLLSNNGSSYQTGAMTIYAKSLDNADISNSFQNNFLSSTRDTFACKFQQQNYGNMRNDQDGLYYRRERSPASLHSMQDFRPRSFYNYHPRHGQASYSHSNYNGRCGSPMSIRSIDSTASMSAMDIIFAFKNRKFNEHERTLIKQAYNKHLKNYHRRKVEKRRKQNRFFKNRRKSGDDSGEMGSDSSICSNDGKSTRTTVYKDDISAYKPTKTNLTNLQTINNERPLYKDCTENIKQNYFKNMLTINPAPQIHKSTEKVCLMKDRFQKGFVFPSQRFHSSIASCSSEVSKSNINKDYRPHIQNEIYERQSNQDSESDQEEIISQISTVERNFNNDISNKRQKTLDNLHKNPVKKCKLSKHEIQGLDNCNVTDKNYQNSFIFAKPQIPVKKSTTVNNKNLNPEILISKSPQLPVDVISMKYNKPQSTEQAEDVNNLEKENNNNMDSKESQPNDVSMRPSFIKRKLFTQRLDIAENKTTRDTSLNVSPQIKGKLKDTGEKNKTRKLTSSQSCLSRDVIEDNNIRDLIHKIVPADRLNQTNSTNQTGTFNKNCQLDSNEKWDVNSVISFCNTNDGSDTYTDEEILESMKKNITKKPICKPQVQSKLKYNCSIVLDKLQVPTSTKTTNVPKKQNTLTGNKGKKIEKKPSPPGKSFWDIESESDFENHELPRNLNYPKINITPIKNTANDKNRETVEIHTRTTLATKAKRTIKKPAKYVELYDVEVPEKPRGKKRKIISDSLQDTSNISNISLRSGKLVKNAEENNQPKGLSKTVALISHRTLRPRRQDKTKPLRTKKVSINKQNEVSGEFNISIQSLRSRTKRNNKH
ncbi:putative mediator of RNA polymerase II transcription subunit 26 [Battus philenor]|uniref:putative mediator of RNA polymerase II transcription subunit 26 n=1 Tax=Battus philenor TaxID=42288 RepID=UPI0035D08896